MEGFSYNIFDRQLENLVNMTQALVSGWDDIMTVEMTIDLKSLCLKASRLCALSDTDIAMQQQDLAHLRTQRNKEWHAVFNSLMAEQVGPLVQRVIANMRKTNKLEGHRTVLFPCHMSSVLPRLKSIMEEDAQTDTEFWSHITEDTEQAEKILRKNVFITKFPGMDYRERFWMLYELFSLLCYLLFHFRKAMKLCNTEISEESAGARLHEIIQYYAQSPEGSLELERYMQALRFDHNGELTLALIKEARTALRKDVPLALQLCFMNHWKDLDALGCELINQNVTTEDYLALIDVLAKCQLLEQEAEHILHPIVAESELYNEVFVRINRGRPVDFKELRSRISRMVKHVTRKNHWFCVWSVLWHKGYLEDKNYGAFARQMMHDDWFGKAPDVLSFTSDTLSDYAGYFTERYYTMWNMQDYQDYRETHDKKKWGESLCTNFKGKCVEMAYAFEDC